MILVDTGPLVASADRSDPNHARCLDGPKSIAAEPLLTTVPCLTECMYFVAKSGGHKGQQFVWSLYQSNKVVIHFHNDIELYSIDALMIKYCDVPMDFADASLLAAAESLNITRILTLDSHFQAYRINGTTPFDILL